MQIILPYNKVPGKKRKLPKLTKGGGEGGLPIRLFTKCVKTTFVGRRPTEEDNLWWNLTIALTEILNGKLCSIARADMEKVSSSLAGLAEKSRKKA